MKDRSAGHRFQTSGSITVDAGARANAATTVPVRVLSSRIPYRLGSALVAAALLSSACEQPAPVELVSTLSQSAFMHMGGVWENWQGGLKGCFVRDPNTTWSSTAFEAREAELVGWFQEWEDASGLDVDWLAQCPAPISDSAGIDDYRGADSKTVFRFFLDTDAPLSGGTAVPGEGCAATTPAASYGSFPSSETNSDNRRYCQFNGRLQPGTWKKLALHEMGHKLGLLHEQDRPDTNGSCTPLSSVGNNVYLTDDDPDSVMGYSNCGYEAETGASLSPLDRIGAEVLYPHSFEPKIVATNASCFGLICREGSVTWTTDWYSRGASESVLSNTEWWDYGWTSSQSLETDFGLGQHLLYVRFDDHLGRAHSAQHVIKADDSLHTAAIMSLM